MRRRPLFGEKEEVSIGLWKDAWEVSTTVYPFPAYDPRGCQERLWPICGSQERVKIRILRMSMNIFQTKSSQIHFIIVTLHPKFIL